MRIHHLTFKFDKNGPDFFKDISVEFEPHKVHFIQGDNGVGKSTLFNILQGKTSSHCQLEGSIELDNNSYRAYNNKIDAKFSTHIHTVQQNYDRMIADQFTFMENLQLANLPAHPGLHCLPEATIFDEMQRLPKNIADTPAHLLSGGQRQLLAILMSLQKPTRVLLLDEPTATLDKKNALMIIECLQQLASHLKVTMLIICHDKELVNTYTDKNYYEIKINNAEQRSVQKIVK